MRGALVKPATIAVALGAIVLALVGCGLGAGPAPTAVQLFVTNEFGARTLSETDAPRVRGLETVMSLLLRNDTVSTRYSGEFVQSIDGLSGGHEDGQPVDWFYFVNGVEANQGAAAVNVHPGDHIWWDHHDWSQTETTPAVVGSFPEPFLNGIEGKRLPVRIECASVGGFACNTVTDRLRALGVPAAIAAIGSAGEPETLRVMVGQWTSLAGELGAQEIERGPRASGVYARFSPRGHTLTLLDQDGHPVETLSAGAGLIAATRHAQDGPVWFVTGTDSRGLALAASAFDQRSLEHRFAAAFGRKGEVALPEAGR